MKLEDLNANEIRVAAYLVGAGLAFLAASREWRSESGSARLTVAWLLLGVVVGTLGLARIVDFGPWLTGVGRHRAELDGWYDDRREVQFWSVWGVALATTVVATGLAAVFPRRYRRALPAALTMVFLTGFVGVRAISFHDVDALLYRYTYHGLMLNTACELSLVLLFGASVAWGMMRAQFVTGWAGFAAKQAHDAGRLPHRKSHLRYVPGDDGARPDHRPAADRHTFEDDRPAADPDVVLDPYSAGR